MTGAAKANTDFGAGFVSPSSDRDFLLKYNAFGEIQWIQYFTELDQIGIHVDHVGQISMGMTVSGYPSIDLADSTIHFGNPFFGTVLWQADHLGNMTHIHVIPDLISTEFVSIPGGSWFVSGGFEDTLSIGGDTIISDTSTGVFFAEISPSGQVQSLRDIPKTGPIRLYELAYSPDQALYMAIHVQDTVFWAGETLVNQALDASAWNFDRLILRYDLQNGEDWSLHFQNKTIIQPSFGTRGFLQAYGATVDEEGNLYTSVRMKGVIDIANTSFSFDQPRPWTYAYKISPQGQILWDKALEASSSAITFNESYIVSHTARYKEGGLYLGGWLNEGVKIGTDTTLTTSLVSPYATGQHYVILKLRADNGGFMWINSVSAPSVPVTLANFSVSQTGNLHISGGFSPGIAPLTLTQSLIHPGPSFTPGLFSGIMVDTSFLDFQQHIHGMSYADDNLDCFPDSNEIRLPQIPIVALPGPYFGMTDLDGRYKLSVDTGSYHVRQLNLNAPGIQGSPYCPVDSVGHQVTLDTGQDTLHIDFSNDVSVCPHLIVLASSSFHRRCFTGEVQLQVLNRGILDADSVSLHVSFPQFITVTGADVAFSFDSTSSTYVFDLGSIPAFGSQQIHITDSVSCDSVDLLGQTQCIQAYASPSNQSFGCISPDPNWSGASLTASGMCLGNDTARFTVLNDAAVDMIEARTFRVFRSDSLIYVDTLLLQANESQLIDVYAAGQDIRLEVDQVAFHPIELRLITGVEGCDSISSFLIVYEDHVPVSPVSDQVSLCDEVIGSFDPNEKYASPAGFGNTHIIEPGQRIRYSIHFQNTGTDTAFKVVLIDTLAPELDPGSLVIHGASHPYTFDMSGVGRPILTFTFDPIFLPDSNVNVEESMGYVSFSVQPYADLPLGTMVNNQAEIYFDFNPPIATSTIFHTIDNLPLYAMPSIISFPQDSISDTTTTSIVLPLKKSDFEIYPNPNSGRFLIRIAPELRHIPEKVEIVSIQGKVIREIFGPQLSASGDMQLDLSSLPQGIYFLRAGSLGIRKVVLTKD